MDAPKYLIPACADAVWLEACRQDRWKTFRQYMDLHCNGPSERPPDRMIYQLFVAGSVTEEPADPLPDPDFDRPGKHAHKSRRPASQHIGHGLAMRISRPMKLDPLEMLCNSYGAVWLDSDTGKWWHGGLIVNLIEGKPIHDEDAWIWRGSFNTSGEFREIKDDR